MTSNDEKLKYLFKNAVFSIFTGLLSKICNDRGWKASIWMQGECGLVRFKTTQEPISGSDLLSQYCTTGAPEVFAQIMRAYGGMVFSVCLKVTKDPADAEDASQATFLTLAVQCKTGAKITYLGPWLKKVAKRSSLDLIRSKKRRTRRENITAENRPEHYSVHPGAKSADSEISQIIRAELDQLPAKYRLPLVLHYFGGLSHEEIGREMKITTAALGVRLHRGRKLLGKRLKARNISLEGMALSAAVVACVNHSLSEHFIHTTTQAVSVMAWSRPGLGSMTALSAALPHHLGIVPQLVGQVARSMHRTRLMLASVALAMSVTLLGGAAEAVRLLPESIRPKLEFLSPTKALENLFKTDLSMPRVQKVEPKVINTQIASSATHEKQSDPAPYVPTIPLPPIATAPIPAPVVHDHPILALEFPPRSYVAAHQNDPTTVALSNLKSTTTNRLADTASTPDFSPPKKYLGPSIGGGSVASSGGSGNNQSGAAETASASAASHDPNAKSISTYSASGSKNTSTATNLQHVSRIGTSKSSLLQGTNLDSSLTATPINAPVQLSSKICDDIVTGSLTLKSNDVFVRPGTGTYSWSDEDHGILEYGTNSIQFAVGNATPGVLTITNLPRKTALAPDRPDGHTFIGIWAVTTDVKYEWMSMTIHYNDLLAQSLGLREEVLKLWAYNGQTWLRINDDTFSRDLTAHTLSGTTAYVQFIGVSAPEPTMLGTIALAAGALLRRRRK